MDSAPSMVHRGEGDTLIVRRVVSGEQLVLDQRGRTVQDNSDNNALLDLRKDPKEDRIGDNNNINNSNNQLQQSQYPLPISLPAAVVAALTLQAANFKLDQSRVDNFQQQQHERHDLDDNLSGNKSDSDANLPQCKIKRNYSCNNCPFFTQNPRKFLVHLRDVHGEKIVINECKFCLYASRHYQKLVRHMKMVHGSTEGINEPGHFRRREKRRRLSVDARQKQMHKQMPTYSPSSSTNAAAVAAASKTVDLNAINQMLQLQNQLQLQLQAQLQNQYQESLPQDIPSDDEMASLDISMNISPNGTKVFKCILCEFSSMEEAQLIQHEKDEHAGTKFYRCKKCSYVTHISARFNKHVKYHSMPMIKCALCDFRTPYKWNLDRHMKNHGGNGPFKCSVCNFTADIKQSLTVHEMNHHIPPLANSMDIERTIDDTPPENINIFDMNESSNSKDDQRSNPSPGSKRKKPMPPLIPIKMTPGSTSAMNQPSSNKSDSEGNQSSAEEGIESDLQQYKIITRLLSKPELSVESVNKSGTNDNLAKLKKKSSFFDMLRKNLIEGNATGSEDKNLVCKCSYEAKTLSDLIIHQKACGKQSESSHSPLFGSTRCQYCRVRFKTSQDLMSHLLKCPGAQIELFESSSEANGDEKMTPIDDYMSDEAAIDNPNERHPMENRVFIWNQLPKSKKEPSETNDDQTLASDKNDDSDDNNLVVNEDDDLPEPPNLTNSEYLGVESAPGYGEITKKIEAGDDIINTAMKKVFKCPHCSFWASTASRFHVHIVGHLNKKPFECSLCAYRSNWRWDITKHIRLKLLRDPQHGEAKVLMNDETGRRNYSKYNRYITLMRVMDKKHDGKLSKSGILNYSPKSSLVQENNVQSPPSSASTPLSVYSDPALNLTASTGSSQLSSMLLEHLSKDMTFLKNLQSLQSLNMVAALNTQNLLQHQQQQQQQQQVAQDAQDSQEKQKDSANEKKTHFKCKKCNFKHGDREVVLEHVKTHYRDDGTPQDRTVATQQSQQIQQSSNSTELAPPPPIPIQMPFQIMSNLLNGHTSGTSNVHNRNLITLGGGGNTNQASNQNPSNTHQTLNFNSQNTLLTPASSTNDVNRNNNGMPETNSTNSNNNSLKGSFRCGHCGQISNWKHVIQRHCRLKHNGDIRIEVAGQKNDKVVRNPQQQQSNQQQQHHNFLQATTSSSSATGSTVLPTTISLHEGLHTQLTTSNVDNGFKPIILPQRMPTLVMTPTTSGITTIMSPPTTTEMAHQLVDNHNKEISLASMLKVEINSVEDHDKVENEIPTNTIFVPQGIQGLTSGDATTLILNQFGQKAKRYKCEMCPYETDSKSQFQYHSSFHKPSRNESYQCKYCSYNVSKRHLLNQHMKMHAASGTNIGDDLNDLQGNISNHEQPTVEQQLTTATEKYMHFCSMCPARYLSLREILNHVKLHEVSATHKCDYCSFSSSDDSNVKAHSAVHTSYYQEKTKEFMAKYKQAQDYPNPELYPIKHGFDDAGASDDVWVVKNDKKKTQDAETSPADENKIDEKCLYCPFQATSLDVLKNHLQYHFAISNVNRSHKCEHCDFSIETPERLREHSELHFAFLKNGTKSLDIFTSFCGLELNATKINTNSNDANNNVNGENIIFKEKDVKLDSDSDSERKDKVIIDV
ncbi:zinc finger protein Xfin isoform X2 [Chironomus tepperi]|uniref:zinc finger protein Xfin isoform X2 n=1 Tax=Chironomus tepperi TaxID=113505 RepID=UPI00391FAB95